MDSENILENNECCNCDCHNKQFNIIAIKIPDNISCVSDRYTALLYARSILKKHKQFKYDIDIVEDLKYYMVIFEKIQNGIKYKKIYLKDNVILYCI